jgi:hypothetical protein
MAKLYAGHGQTRVHQISGALFVDLKKFAAVGSSEGHKAGTMVNGVDALQGGFDGEETRKIQLSPFHFFKLFFPIVKPKSEYLLYRKQGAFGLATGHHLFALFYQFSKHITAKNSAGTGYKIYHLKDIMKGN